MNILLFEISDPRCCIITLTKDRYETHILAGHPEMTDVGVIIKTVEQPWFIAQDAKDDLVEIYYQYGADPKYPKLWVRVVVKQGRVLTAHLAHNLKSTEKVIWMQKS